MPEKAPTCNCQPFRLVMIAQKDESYTCPLCRVNVRVAQYGGHGGGSVGYAPGGSPMGQSGAGGSGWGINSKYVDETFESILGKSRKNFLDDANRNIERRLEPSHAYSEEDSIPYNLSQEERKKLRIKKNVWRREHLNSETKKSIDENRPEYINSHFFPSEQQMRTLEQSLESRHLEPKNRDRREDESPAQDRPTRIHTSEYFSDPRVAEIFNAVLEDALIKFANDLNYDHGTNRMKGEEEEGLDDTTSVEKFRYHNFPLGNSTVLTTGAEVDQHLGDMNNLNFGGNLENRGGEGGGDLNATTIQDFPRPDQIGDHAAVISDPIPSPLSESGVPRQENSVFNNTSVGTEAKLRELHNPKGQRLPQDPYSRVDRDEFENRNGEPLGAADKYPGFNNPLSAGGVAW